MAKDYISVGYFVFSDGSERLYRTAEIDEYAEGLGLGVVSRPNPDPLFIYDYEFSNGRRLRMTLKDARNYMKKEGVEVYRGGPMSHSTVDIYTGYNPGLGCEVRDKGHYNRLLKEKGLVEVGNEATRGQSVKKPGYFDDESIKKAVDMGATISDREAGALKEGKIKANTEDN